MEYASFLTINSLIIKHLIQSYRADYWTFKDSYQTFPIDSVNSCVFLKFNTHKAISISKTLLMQIIGMTFVMNHLYLTLVFRHENIDITIMRIPMVTGTDYLRYTRSLASHVMKGRQIIEVLQARYTQHRPSSFSTSCFNSG